MAMQTWPATAATVIGTYFLVMLAYKIFAFAWLYTRPSSLSRYARPSPTGQPAWALVTGASAGLGKCLADELAGAGFNVVLHGRNASKLDAEASELSRRHPGRSFRTLVVDASTCHLELERWGAGGDGGGTIAEQLRDLHLTVLVNNAGGVAGVLPRAYGTLETYGAREILDTVHLNAVFPTLITAAVLPLLLRNGPSLVVNICSLSDNGLPLISFYGAAKIFNRSLSVSLSRETSLSGREKQLEVIAHRIGMVSETSGTTDMKPDFGGPSARTVARAVLARTGCGRKTVIPYWGHAIQQVLVELAPEWIADKAFNETLKNLRDEEVAKKND